MYFEQNPFCCIMLEPKEVYTPRFDRIEYYLVAETLVHSILSTMPYSALHYLVPFGNQAQITKKMVSTW